MTGNPPELHTEVLRVYGIFQERAASLERLRAEPDRLAGLKSYYREHIADFINDWGVTVDPRNASKGLPTALPFTLDQRQREWIGWTHRNWLDEKYGGTEKARDVGVSWLLIAYSISIAVLWDGVSVGWGSFSEIKVDKRGEMGSLFEKGREYLRWLPPELSSGWTEQDDECNKKMFLKFPSTGSTIFGEIGDNVGRGNRASIYFVDETAYFEHDTDIDAALSKTTNCRQDVSSVRGMENTFAQRMHKPLAAGSSLSMGEFLEEGERYGVRKFVFTWQDNPRFTEADYQDFLATWGETITAQELDRNYQASVDCVVIPGAWVNAALDAHVKLNIHVRGVRVGSLDISDQGIDKNAFVASHGIKLIHAQQWTGKASTTIETTKTAFLACDLHECRELVYDAGGGYGSGVQGYGDILNDDRGPGKEGGPIITLIPHLGAGAVVDPQGEMVKGQKNENLFDNFKAQSWWSLRLRFEKTFRAVVQGANIPHDELISIPSELPERAQLMIELSRPTYGKTKTGLLLVNKQPANSPSPNLGDSVCMLFAPRGPQPIQIDDSILDNNEW